jgi:WD40 repeat protein
MATLLVRFVDYILDIAMHRPSLLLSTSRDSTVKLFDYLTGHELVSVNLFPSWSCTVTFSSDGEYFATGSFDNNVIIFRTKDGARVREIRTLNLGIMCVRFPRDLTYITVGTVEGFLQQIPL